MESTTSNPNRNRSILAGAGLIMAGLATIVVPAYVLSQPQSDFGVTSYYNHVDNTLPTVTNSNPV